MSLECVLLKNLGQWLVGKADWVLFSVSYEARSPMIRRSLSDVESRFMAFHNTNHGYNTEALESARRETPGLVEVPLNSDAPLQSLDSMREAVASHIVETPAARIVIDITCFTRESLAMLIKTLRHLLPASRIHCLYNKASSYGQSSIEDEHHGWLTHGIVGIRSILGFRGRVKLIADTHLIVLPGFEAERAHGIIDALQPNRLTIGHSDPSECIQPEFAPVAGAMNERLLNFYRHQRMGQISFSSRDPNFTRNAILGCVAPSDNTVVACLNTKLAMLGAIMAALSDDAIQLIYAQPAHYNIKALSAPSDEALAFELP